MRVVAMVALWSLVQAVMPECWYGCRLVNISIAVEMGDGSTCSVETQACAGMCHNKEPVYVSPSGQATQQTSCHYLKWTYEPVPDYCYTSPGLERQTVPKALSCVCSSCDTDSYDCSTLSPSMATCSPYGSLMLKRHL